MIFEEVPLSAVDFEDETFRISEDLALARMKSSLQAVGQINPVILLERAVPSGYIIVCGFRRLHALRLLGGAVASARVLPPASFSMLEVFLKAVWDNLAHRQLGPLETARVLFTLKHRCDLADDALVARFLPMLGLSPHHNVLRSYLSLHGLRPDLRALLNAGHLTLASVEHLAHVAPEVQGNPMPVLGKIRLSASLQREVLELAEDLAAISESTLAEVLNLPELLAIADDASLSAFQKGERIRSFLYCRRNPRISKAKDAFRAEKARLDLPGTVRVSPHPFFESPQLRVEFDAHSAQAFREMVAALERACHTASLDRLFQIS